MSQLCLRDKSEAWLLRLQSCINERRGCLYCKGQCLLQFERPRLYYYHVSLPAGMKCSGAQENPFPVLGVEST